MEKKSETFLAIVITIVIIVGALSLAYFTKDIVTIKQLKQNPDAYRDRNVTARGVFHDKGTYHDDNYSAYWYIIASPEGTPYIKANFSENINISTLIDGNEYYFTGHIDFFIPLGVYIEDTSFFLVEKVEQI